MADKKTQGKKFEDLCAGYVLNALDMEERKVFEQMLEEASEEERMLYQNMHSAANQLAFTVERHEPSPVLKDQLMEQVASANEERVKSDIPSVKDEQEVVAEDEDGFNWSAFGLAASFALLIITLSLIFYAFSLNSEINEKESVIDEQETQIMQLEDELQQKEEMLSILQSREIEIVVMSGMEVNPDGHGKIIWNTEQQQALLQVSNLPTVSQGRTYQLWILTSDKPVSAGVFSVNDEHDNFFQIEEFTGSGRQSANGFAVTQEPENGSQQPTGDMYLMGNMD